MEIHNDRSDYAIFSDGHSSRYSKWSCFKERVATKDFGYCMALTIIAIALLSLISANGHKTTRIDDLESKIKLRNSTTNCTQGLDLREMINNNTQEIDKLKLKVGNSTQELDKSQGGDQNETAATTATDEEKQGGGKSDPAEEAQGDSQNKTATTTNEEKQVGGNTEFSENDDSNNGTTITTKSMWLEWLNLKRIVKMA